MDLANRARRIGGVQPHRLYHECVAVFRAGGIPFDEVTSLYKHAMLHAGAIRPRDRPRFEHCPECGEQLDIPAQDN